MTEPVDSTATRETVPIQCKADYVDCRSLLAVAEGRRGRGAGGPLFEDRLYGHRDEEVSLRVSFPACIISRFNGYALQRGLSEAMKCRSFYANLQGQGSIYQGMLDLCR